MLLEGAVVWGGILWRVQQGWDQVYMILWEVLKETLMETQVKAVKEVVVLGWGKEVQRVESGGLAWDERILSTSWTKKLMSPQVTILGLT